MTDQNTTAGGSAAAAPRRRFGPWLWVAALAVVLALIVVGVRFYRATVANEREAAVEQTVVDFYGALASGNADKALGYAATPPEQRDLLTDDVLRASQEAAPIKDVKVSDVQISGAVDQAVARVTYLIGDSPVATQVGLLSTDHVTWKLADVTSELSVSPVKGAKVNGASVTQQVNAVFPGTYVLTPASDNLDVTATPGTVTDPAAGVTSLEGTMKLSKDGRDSAEKAAKAALKKCLASKAPNPSGCPWVIKGDNVRKNTVSYSVSGDPWQGYRPAYNADTQTATDKVDFRLTARAMVKASDGSWQSTTTSFPVKTDVTVDFSDETPVVRWANR